jgi:hypothetical protein
MSSSLEQLKEVRQMLILVQDTFYEALIEGGSTNLEAGKGVRALIVILGMTCDPWGQSRGLLDYLGYLLPYSQAVA